MAASKKIQLRMGWSGDQFHLGEVRFDGEGAWDKDNRPVKFTETEAAEAMKTAHQNGITLVLIEDTETDTASGGPSSGQEG